MIRSPFNPSQLPYLLLKWHDPCFSLRTGEPPYPATPECQQLTTVSGAPAWRAAFMESLRDPGLLQSRGSDLHFEAQSPLHSSGGGKEGGEAQEGGFHGPGLDGAHVSVPSLCSELSYMVCPLQGRLGKVFSCGPNMKRKLHSSCRIKMCHHFMCCYLFLSLSCLLPATKSC